MFTATELVRRLLALLPSQGVHLTVFAPNAKLRPRALVELVSGACAKEGSAPRRPRLDWATLQRRTFNADVWRCPCGGRRQVVAVVSNRRTAEEVLRNLGRLPPKPVPRTGQSVAAAAGAGAPTGRADLAKRVCSSDEAGFVCPGVRVTRLETSSLAR